MALKYAQKILVAGADILDMGGLSSRPGAVPVDEAEELNRTQPVLEAIGKKFVYPISIDTVKYIVARAALDSGAGILHTPDLMVAAAQASATGQRG